MRYSVSEYIKEARVIQKSSNNDVKEVNLTIISSFTIEFLIPSMVVESYSNKIKLKTTVAPFNQFEQQILDDDSILYKSLPDIIMIAMRIDELDAELLDLFYKMDIEEIECRISNIFIRFQNAIREIRQKNNAKIIIWNFFEPRYNTVGLLSPHLTKNLPSILQNLNDLLGKISRENSDVCIFDIARVQSELGINNFYDSKMFYLSRCPFTSAAHIAISQRISRLVKANLSISLKCLILDLDNTLWGGVIGEDGLGGIQIGEDYPGNVFKHFQLYLRAMKNQGVLLAIASKNNENDAWEAIDNHPDMILRRNDFVSYRINWNDKASNIEEIAAELNIGLDSVAFFDDSPVEREWVSSRLEKVRVIDTPAEPRYYIETLQQSGLFDQLHLVLEDFNKTDYYINNRARDRFEKTFVSKESFLKELKTQINIGLVTNDSLPRFSQLIMKTNQFNLTNRRHSASSIKKLIEDNAICLWLRAKDRFGDHSIVGCSILIPQTINTWKIDTFLLSCRVIGRGIETAFLSVICKLLKSRGAVQIVGEYVDSKRNVLVKSFYSDHRFIELDNLWYFNVEIGEIKSPDGIEIIIEEGLIG